MAVVVVACGSGGDGLTDGGGGNALGGSEGIGAAAGNTNSGGAGNGSADGGNGLSGAGGYPLGDCSGNPLAGPDMPDVVMAVAGVTVSTLAGSESSGIANGTGVAAHFNNPVNLLVDEGNELLIADFDNGLIRSSSMGGVVGTLTEAVGFARPFGLALGQNGKLFVGTDFDATGANAGPKGGVLWMVDLATGVPTVIAAEVGRPRGLLSIDDGVLAVTDVEGDDIRTLDVATGTFSELAGKRDCAAFADGAADVARFNRPYGVVAMDNGDLIVADQNNHRIRRVTLSGTVSTLAGDGAPGLIDGPVAEARFNLPEALAVDGSGNIYVSDVGNHRIRRISSAGVVETIAGDGTAGFANGSGTAARFSGQEGLVVGPDGSVYVADGTNGEIAPYHRIRKITLP